MTIALGISEDILNTKRQIELLSSLALNIPTDDVAAVAEWIQMQDTLLPIFDPSTWMDVAGNIPDHLAVATAFLAFRRALDKVMKP